MKQIYLVSLVCEFCNGPVVKNPVYCFRSLDVAESKAATFFDVVFCSDGRVMYKKYGIVEPLTLFK